MKDLRIEITDEATALYIAVDPDGIWARTTEPDELITVDWDAQGRVIGIEVIGSAAREAVGTLATALVHHQPLDDPDAVRAAVQTLLPTSTVVTQ